MRKLIFTLGVIILFAGCAPYYKVMHYTNFKFLPTSSVEVLRTRPVDREYIELGEVSIRLDAFTPKNPVLFLAEVARKLGADALLLLDEKDTGAVILPFFGTYISEKKEKLVGIAIRYK